MKKKPDLIVTLVALFVVGLLVSSLAKTASVNVQERDGMMVTTPEMDFALPEDFE